MQRTPWLIVLRIGDSKHALTQMFLAATLCAITNVEAATRDPFGPESNTFDFDESQVDKWKESAVVLPTFPAEADLITVPSTPSVSLKLYLDSKSLSRPADRTVRFTLVVESPSGVRNVFYEAMRCESRQHKTHAIGSSEHGLVAVKDAAWRTIPRAEVNGFRDYLYKHFVCDDQHAARAPKELLRLLRYSQ